PLQVAEHFPEMDAGTVDRRAAALLVGAEELLALADATNRLVVAAKAPGAHAHPAQVLGSVADVRELPIENRAQPLAADDDVAVPVAAVHQYARRSRRQVAAQPAEGELKCGVRLGCDAAVDLFPPIDLGGRRRLSRLRGGQEAETVPRDVDAMDAGQ